MTVKELLKLLEGCYENSIVKIQTYDINLHEFETNDVRDVALEGINTVIIK